MGEAAKKNKIELFNILRLVTPMEVAIMTKVSTGVKRVSLTGYMDGTETFDDSTENESDKVISLEKEKEKREEADLESVEKSLDAEEVKAKEQRLELEAEGAVTKETHTTSSEVNVEEASVEAEVDLDSLELSKEERALRAAGVESKKEMLAKKQAEEERRNKEKSSTTVFILTEKEKMKEGQNKLRKSEIITSYSKSVNIQIDKKDESEEEQDLSKSSIMGIIINKRQF